MLEGVEFCLRPMQHRLTAYGFVESNEVMDWIIIRSVFGLLSNKRIDTPSPGRYSHEEALMLVFLSQSRYRFGLGMEK